MATVRMAAGSVLGTVTDTANAISSTVNTISGGMGILNDMVTTMRNKRQESTLVEMISYRSNLISDAALEQVKREENIRNYIGSDPAKQEAYNNFSNKLNEAFTNYDKTPESE